jgi:hypothetical protein
MKTTSQTTYEIKKSDDGQYTFIHHFNDQLIYSISFFATDPTLKHCLNSRKREFLLHDYKRLRRIGMCLQIFDGLYVFEMYKAYDNGFADELHSTYIFDKKTVKKFLDSI